MTLKTSTILVIIATTLAFLAEASRLLYWYFFSFGLIGVLIRLFWFSSLILFFSVLLKNQIDAEKLKNDNSR